MHTKLNVMKRIITLAASVTLAVFFLTAYVACTKDSCADVTCQHGGTCSGGNCSCPSGYTGTHCETQTCAANNTASIQFSNRSANKTYSVVWDGSVITTLAAGVTSDYFTVAAGQHTLEFRYSNSSTDACTLSTPNVAQCSSTVYWCSN